MLRYENIFRVAFLFSSPFFVLGQQRHSKWPTLSGSTFLLMVAPSYKSAQQQSLK
jgi:hypothetical protein